MTEVSFLVELSWESKKLDSKILVTNVTTMLQMCFVVTRKLNVIK